MKKIWIWILSGVVLVSIVVSVVVINNNSKNNTEDKSSDGVTSSENNKIPSEIGNTNGNTVNNGNLAVKGDWIYYAVPYGDGIYKMKTDGTENQKILTCEIQPKSSWPENYAGLNVIGDWIYYVNSETKEFYKVKVDGTENQKIGNWNNNISLTQKEKYYMFEQHANLNTVNLIAIDDWIYYNDDGFYKMKTDGTEKQRLIENSDLYNANVRVTNISDGWIYAHGNGIYRMKIDGTEKQQLIYEGKDTDKITKLIVDGEWMYYQCDLNSDLYKMKIDGTEKQKLIENIAIEDFNVLNGYIYYNRFTTQYETSEVKGLYKMKTDGTDNQKIDNDTPYNIYIIDNWVYCMKYVGSKCEFYKIKTDGTDKQIIKTTEMPADKIYQV